MSELNQTPAADAAELIIARETYEFVGGASALHPVEARRRELRAKNPGAELTLITHADNSVEWVDDSYFESVVKRVIRITPEQDAAIEKYQADREREDAESQKYWANALALARTACASPALHKYLREDDHLDELAGWLMIFGDTEGLTLFRETIMKCCSDCEEIILDAWNRHHESPGDWRELITHVRELDRAAGVESPAASSLLTAASVPVARFKPAIPNLAATPPRWLVKGLLLEGSLAFLFGRWGTGKTTVAIELCVAIARELPWHGRKTRGGLVVYISCESPHGVRLRLSAQLKEQGITIDDLHGNFLEIAARPHLLKPDDVQALIAELQALGPVALIVVDTLARAMAGTEENSAKDAGILVGNCQTISEKTGACVLLLHHTGKDASRGMRGSSNLPASADTEIELERPSETDNVRIAKLGKQRDAPDYCDLFHYELVAVTLGQDEDGDPITSTVVREIEPPSKVKMTNEVPKHPFKRAVWSTLDNAMRPMGAEELITSAAASLVHDPASNKRDRRRDCVRQAVERMAQEGLLTRSPDGLYQIRRPEIVDSATPVHERFSPITDSGSDA
jgi:hypothetical protein